MVPTWAKMIRADLEAASISYHDVAGRVFDFHALRHQFISSLAAAAVHPKIVPPLARHSAITLTIDYYSHVPLLARLRPSTNGPSCPMWAWKSRLVPDYQVERTARPDRTLIKPVRFLGIL